jgi:hypothetical protein
MLQMFYLDVAYVVVAIHICCKCMFQMFHLFHTYLAECYMLQVFSLAGSMRSSSMPRRTVVGAWEHVQPSNGVQQQAHAGTCRLAATCNSRMRRCAAASCACGHMKIRMLRS